VGGGGWGVWFGGGGGGFGVFGGGGGGGGGGVCGKPKGCSPPSDTSKDENGIPAGVAAKSINKRTGEKLLDGHAAGRGRGALTWEGRKKMARELRERRSAAEKDVTKELTTTRVLGERGGRNEKKGEKH